MPDNKQIKIEGKVTDVFAHRFVIETADKRILADLGPKGVAAFVLKSGTQVIAEGDLKPSELKVSSIAVKGGTPVVIERPAKKEHGDGLDHAVPDVAVKTAVTAGYEVLGAPRRKPKHFEVLGRKDGKIVECHVEFDGSIRKVKLVEAADDKWAFELESAA